MHARALICTTGNMPSLVDHKHKAEAYIAPGASWLGGCSVLTHLQANVHVSAVQLQWQSH